MANKVVSLEKFKIERQYQEFHTSTSLNLALDTYQPTKRDVRKEMIYGYMKLLSNK